MHKVVHASEGSVRQIAPDKTALNLITKDISSVLSLAVTEATDYREKEVSAQNRIYYVLEGQMMLRFDNEEANLQPGDACYIAKGTTYEMSGTFNSVVVNQPAFGTEGA